MPGDTVELALGLSLVGCERCWHSTTPQPHLDKTHSGTKLHSMVHVPPLRGIPIEGTPSVVGVVERKPEGPKPGRGWPTTCSAIIGPPLRAPCFRGWGGPISRGPPRPR